MESSRGKALPASSAGASLIEVLVALSILSLGLAGLSAMQLATLEYLGSVVYQSRASLHGGDMAETLRGKISNGESAAGAITQWQETIGAALPAGRAVVCVDSTPQDGAADLPSCDGVGAAWAIKIWWDDDRDGNPERMQLTVLRP